MRVSETVSTPFVPTADTGILDLARLDVGRSERVREAWERTRGGAPVIVAIGATFVGALFAATSGCVVVTPALAGEVAFACWALASVQGALVWWRRRRAFVAACALLGLSAEAAREVLARLDRGADLSG